MSAPTPNLPLMDAVEAQIDAHPETWDQTVYRNDCGTAYCYAGWAVTLTLGEGEWLRGDFLFHQVAHARAASLLGLTRCEANALFCANNSREDIALVSKHIRERAAEQGAAS